MGIIRLTITMLFLLSLMTNVTAATYNMNRTVGAYTIVGTLETNVDTGFLDITNFVDWDVTVTYLPTSAASDFNPSNSRLFVLGQALSATPNGLVFITALAGIHSLTFFNDLEEGWAIQSRDFPCGGDPRPCELTQLDGLPLDGNFGIDTTVIVAELQSVPVPAAAWLFVTAIAMISCVRRVRYS